MKPKLLLDVTDATHVRDRRAWRGCKLDTMPHRKLVAQTMPPQLSLAANIPRVWMMLLAPANLPKPVKRKLNDIGRGDAWQSIVHWSPV